MSATDPLALPVAETSAHPDVEVLRDLPFAPGLALDLYRPRGATSPLPVVLYLHGGGWRVGTRSDREADRQIPLAAQGFAVASASYRLSGVSPFPAPRDDAMAALQWLHAQAGALGLDRERLAVAGASAGAQLASLVGLADGLAAPVKAVVAWFTVTDLVNWDVQWRDAPYPAPHTFAWQGAQRRGWPPPPRAAALLGVERIEDAPAEAVRAADPRSHIAAAVARGPVPPFLLLHGDADTAVETAHSRLLHDALRAAGVSSTLLVLGDADHEDAAFGQPAPLGAVAGFLKAAVGAGGR